MDNSTPLKRCCKCKQFFPRTPEYFNRNRSAPDGLHFECRECRFKSRSKTRRLLRTPDPNKLLPCSVCGREFPATLEFFRLHRNHLKAQCRQCDAVDAQSYRDMHHDRVIDGQRRYEKEHRRERVEKGRRQRSRKRNLPHTFTESEWEYALNYFGGCCAICGRPPGLWHTIAREHWIPLCDTRPNNPGTVATNIVPMCHAKKDGKGGCNNSKSRKDPLEWLTERYGKRKANQIASRILAYFASLSVQSGEHVIKHIRGT